MRNRQLSELSTPVNPSDYGVKFDYDLGKCMFTKDFVLGMVYNSIVKKMIVKRAPDRIWLN